VTVLLPKIRRKAAASVAVLLLCGFAACSSKEKPSSGARPPEKRPAAPDFSLRDLKGDVVSLAQFRGKVVFLDFWATWCPPCRMSMPSVQKLQKDYADRGFQVLGLSVDEDTSGVANFIQRMGISYPILLVNNSGVDGQYGISAVPSFLLIDKKGRVAQGWMGFESSYEARWRRSVEAELSK
jgi:cytochrome c biogenesis protein CcmG, thiol:disulfide interchange protein DsbE